MDPATASHGRILANEILKQYPGKDVVKICQNESFYKDPTAHLIREMIDRDVGRCREDDGARSFVISMIPDFSEKVGSIEYLKKFSIEYFKDHPQAEKILAVFERSINSSELKKNLSRAVDQYKRKEFYYAEDGFRVALTVFSQSENLNMYEYPDAASLE